MEQNSMVNFGSLEVFESQNSRQFIETLNLWVICTIFSELSYFFIIIIFKLYTRILISYYNACFVAGKLMSVEKLKHANGLYCW